MLGLKVEVAGLTMWGREQQHDSSAVLSIDIFAILHVEHCLAVVYLAEDLLGLQSQSEQFIGLR